MTEAATVAVLIPAAPRDDVVDTVRSVHHWMPDSPVVVVNDSDELVLPAMRNTVVLPALPFPRNAYGGLWTKVAFALDWIVQNLEVDYVLRLDADAVVLRPGLETAVGKVFADPAVGIAGGVALHGNGSIRDFGPAARAIAAATSVRGLRSPRARTFTRELSRQARAHGHRDGEHAIACACILRMEMVMEWRRRGWLRSTALSRSRLGDDFIMTLMCFAAGYRLADIGGRDGAVCLSWRDLPMSPSDLLAGPAYATHSVRAYGDMTERDVRAYFSASRAASVRD